MLSKSTKRKTGEILNADFLCLSYRNGSREKIVDFINRQGSFSEAIPLRQKHPVAKGSKPILLRGFSRVAQNLLANDCLLAYEEYVSYEQTHKSNTVKNPIYGPLCPILGHLVSLLLGQPKSAIMAASSYCPGRWPKIGQNCVGHQYDSFSQGYKCPIGSILFSEFSAYFTGPENIFS